MFQDVWTDLAWGIGVLLEHVLGSTSEGFQWCLQSMLYDLCCSKNQSWCSLQKSPNSQKKRKGVVFWHTYDHFLLFFPVSWRKKRLTSPGTFGHLGFLTPRPCRGGTAEEAVQKSAEKKDDTLLLMLVLQGVCWCNLGNSIIYSNDLYTLFATIVIYHYMNQSWYYHILYISHCITIIYISH